MADFNFYLNRQGIQGRKGDKGDAGFTPTISVSEQTLNSYKLKITNEYNEFETPNLIGNLGVTDNGGTYLRYDPATGTVSAGEIDGATTEVVGGVRKSTDADLTNLSADTAVTPANVADMLPLLLEAGTDNVTITQDEATSKTKISVEGGSSSGDVTAAGDNRFTGDNTFTGKVNIAGGALTVDGLATLNQTTAQYLNAVSITSSGEINAVSIKANGLRSDDIQTTENKKYLTELDVDNQTIQVVNGKLHANLDELGNEVNDLTGRVTANEADISALKTGKQNKLTAGANVILTDLSDGTVRIDATGGGGTGDIPIATTTTAGKVKPDGTTITITDDGTISAVGGSGGGVTIDDSTTATTSVWSSSKTNTEITTVANEVAQVQGDVARLSGDVYVLKNDDVQLKTNVSGLQTEVSTLKTNVSTLKTDVSGLKTDVSGLKTSKQNTLVSGTNIKTINGETILGEGNIAISGGEAPANMVTTDTAQTITGKKIFSNFGQHDAITFEYTGATPRPKGFIGMDRNNSGGLISLGVDYNNYGGNKIIVGSNIALGGESSKRGIRFSPDAGGKQDCHLVMGATNYASSIDFLNSSNSITLNPFNGGHLDIGNNSLTFTKKDGTVTNLLTGGGSAPTNMVTTDTAQDITANKTFYGEIRVGADNNYATLAKFSKEALVSGSSTLSEHIDLGEADFVVQGNLGKKVYDTNKYVYKKYINVDDLSDNQIKMDNSISSQVAHMAMPSDKYIDLTLGASGTTYTAPADGWFCFFSTTQGINLYNPQNKMRSYVAGTSGSAGFIPVKKGAIVALYNVAADATFNFVYAVGSEPTE